MGKLTKHNILNQVTVVKKGKNLMAKKKKLVYFSLFFMLTLPSISFAEKKSRFEQLELFNKVLYLIESQYYREVDTEKLILGALKGMMEALDPHSNFLGKESFEKMKVDTSGEFGGLGIEVTQKDGVIYIITPLDDTPAYKAGIRAGDKIIEIDHEPTLGLTLEEAVKKMKGQAKTKVNLGILREGVEGIKEFSIVREIIKVRPVKFDLVEDRYAFIRLTQFQHGSAEAIEDAIAKMRKQTEKNNGLEGIILDLRSNPGGLLDEAVKVSSIFLSEGIVVSTEGRDPKNKEIRYVIKKGKKELELPMVVLINGSSASASEIVAGALQDYNRAIIMGTQSFGKGSVQTVAKIDEENGVKLTIAQYMTPKNRKIQAIGIKPDIELDEFEAAWIKENKKDLRFIREKDLKGHLMAIKESEEEKELRLKQEREERAERIKEMNREKEEKLLKKNKEEKGSLNNEENEELFKKYNPKTDYQVLQAINFLKSYKVFNKYQSAGDQGL